MTDSLQFKISSSLKDIIGKDLITDDFIAVFELVKNSYDAHAKKVKLNFEDNKITIWDNGKGMSLQDIQEKWLFVAYSAKKEGTEDEDILNEEEYKDYRDKIVKRKYYAGAKGIGRFSCDRLGQVLTLFSRKVNHKEIEKIIINWDDFEEDSKKEFINVKVKHETLLNSPFSDFSHGTILQISNLSDPWHRKKILTLKHSLEKLINPFESLPGHSLKEIEFSIEFISETERQKDSLVEDPRQKVNGKVQSFIFDRLNVATTQILTNITQNWITSELIDRGTPIYKIREKNIEYSYLEEANFHLYYLNKGAKSSFTKTLGLEPVRFGSIFLFKNGFRIYPIGEEGDDSLKIDRRKQQGYARYLGTRDLLGRIEIFGQGDIFNEQFKETTSRDSGLIDSEGYEELKDAFREKCLLRLEKYVVDIQWALKETDDKLREDTAAYKLDSKRKIISIIHSLTSAKNLELLYYNKNFLNIVRSKDGEYTEALDQLFVIAQKSNDIEFASEIQQVKKEYQKLQLAKEKAEARARKAEEEKIEAEIRKAEAEKRQKEEEHKRKEAELKIKEEEQKRKDAELREREAKLQAKEEEEKRKTTEIELATEKTKNTYLSATSRGLSADAEALVHSIKLVATNIDAVLETLLKNIRKDWYPKEYLLEKLGNIHRENLKALRISELITRANFKAEIQQESLNLPKYIQEYIGLLNEIFDGKIKFKFETSIKDFWLLLSILEISIIFDDLASNAQKGGATEVLVEIENAAPDILSIYFSDNGYGINEKYLSMPEKIFELGVTETSGSGIGLYNARKSLRAMNGDICFYGNNKILKGATFKLTFKV